MTYSNIPPLVQNKAFAVIADHIESAGLRIEDNFRVSSQGMALSHAAANVLNKTGCPVTVQGNDSLQEMGIDRTGGFWHPLTEFYSEEETGLEGGGLNLWGSASFMTNIALGWIGEDEEEVDPESADEYLSKIISMIAPTVSLSDLMKAARYSDAHLLRLVELVQRGLETQSEKEAQ